MLLRRLIQASGLLASLLPNVGAITLNINDQNSIIEASNLACDNAMTFYQGNQPGQIPGIPDQPYYWWEAGGLFGVLIQRWSITGNSSLNSIITQGIQFQVGQNDNFEPVNQTKDLGNDDQVFWAFATMDAAELQYPNPPPGDPSWTALAQAVFNRQTARWDSENCGGGMRWQVVLTNPGWDYKNIMSNGGYFQLAARLARYTGNATYAKYAEKMYDWIASSPMYANSTEGLQIWDGIHIENCSAPEQLFWSYNAATMLVGSAYMYNYTNGSGLWEQRINDILGATNVFFVKSLGANNPPQMPSEGGTIMCEVACERQTPQSCNQDEPSFKAYTSRWLAMTTVLAPFTYNSIWPRLVASAQGAAGQCIGTAAGQTPGTSCGRRWYQSSWDGYSGLGEHMSAMSVFQNLLIHNTKAPVTLLTGGTSQGDAGAGSGGPSDLSDDPFLTSPITAGDKFGASVLTIFSVGLAVGGSLWMSTGP